MLSIILHYLPGQELAIIGPGSLASNDYADIKDLAERFANKGYIAIRFDPTGTWQSKGKIEEYSTSSYLNNFNTIAEYGYKKFNISKITAVGHSFGGMVALLFANKNKNVKRVVSIMPLTQNTINKAIRLKWKRTGNLTYPKNNPFNKNKIVTFNVLYSFVQDLQTYNLNNIVVNSKAYKLFIASDIDEYCKAEDIYKFYYQKATKPKDLMLIKGIRHSYMHDSKQIKLVNMCRSFKDIEKLRYMGHN